MDGASALGAAVEKSCKHCGTNRSSLLSISSLQGKKASMAGYHYSHNSLYPRHLPNFFLLISREWDRACLVPAQGLQILFSFSTVLGRWEHAKIMQSVPIQKEGAKIDIAARETHSLCCLGHCWLQNREDWAHDTYHGSFSKNLKQTARDHRKLSSVSAIWCGEFLHHTMVNWTIPFM